MNEYIFYTSEGYCESPLSHHVENFQILGFEKGNSKEEALENLLKNNSLIKDYSYSIDEIIGCQILR